MILSLSGKSLAGKDTTADVLVDRFGFKKLSWADPLKEMCSEVFDIPIRYFYDTDLKDKKEGFVCCVNSGSVSKLVSFLRREGYTVGNKLRNSLEVMLGGSLFETPRQLMTIMGTDICRRFVDDDIWINITMKRAKEHIGSLVIPDSRFINEIDAVVDIGGRSAIVCRPDTLNTNAEGHKSEDVPAYNYDFEFINNCMLGAFQEEVALWYFLRTSSERVTNNPYMNN